MHNALFGLNLNGYWAPRVLWQRYTRTPGIFQSLTELTEGPGIVARAYRTHRCSAQVKRCCTRTPGICGTGVQKLLRFGVRVWMLYRTYRSSGYGYECATKLTEVLCRVIPEVNTPGMVLYVPYRTQPCKRVTWLYEYTYCGPFVRLSQTWNQILVKMATIVS